MERWSEIGAELLEAWLALPRPDQIWFIEFALFVVGFLALFVTPLGRRRLAWKCLPLAALVHLLLWQAGSDGRAGPAREPGEAKVTTITLRPERLRSPMARSSGALGDPLAESLSTTPTLALEPEKRDLDPLERTKEEHRFVAEPMEPPSVREEATPVLEERPTPEIAVEPADPSRVDSPTSENETPADPDPGIERRSTSRESQRRSQRRSARPPRLELPNPGSGSGTQPIVARRRISPDLAPAPAPPFPAPAPAPKPIAAAGPEPRLERDRRSVADDKRDRSVPRPELARLSNDRPSPPAGIRLGPPFPPPPSDRPPALGPASVPPFPPAPAPAKGEPGPPATDGQPDSPTSPTGLALSARPPEMLRNRTVPERLEIVLREGGTEETELAVARALEWLARNQSETGLWDASAHGAIEAGSDMGVTGLALLAFLGAGHTHRNSARYAETVRTGLNALVRAQTNAGSLAGEGRIYCHAMATLALTEVMALTDEQRLLPAARSAIAWLVAAQHPESGGWRYGPGQFGDTSVYGWAVMALYSAREAGIEVPEPAWQKAKHWLTLVSSGREGHLACYRPGFRPSHSMTAEALLCRQLFGLEPGSPLIDSAAAHLLARPPAIEDYHLYYWYYGTLALHQVGGQPWNDWNERLKRTLLATQRLDGPLRGSWDPKRPFGVDGGRIFTTATSALCLEAYYRYLPLYRGDGAQPPPAKPIDPRP